MDNRPHIAKIKINSPKAWEKYANENTKGHGRLKWLGVTNEDLYEFFDSQNLFISILRFGQESEIYDDKWWMYTFTDIDLDGDQGYYTSRPEAEQAAFERAFEILNNKL